MHLSRSGGSVGAVSPTIPSLDPAAIPRAMNAGEAGVASPRSTDLLGTVAPATVVRFLAGCVVALTLFHSLASYVWHVMGYDHAKGFVPLFYLDSEANAPTWFSSSILLMAGLLALLIASRSRTGRWHWAAMGFIAVFLSFDEAAQFHEMVSAGLRDVLSLGGGFSWTIVALVSGLPILLAGGLFYRFLRSLPRETFVGLATAGVVYVMGVVGVDTIATIVHAQQGGWLLQLSLNTVEELLEMAGVILLIHVLLTHLAGLVRHDAAARAGAGA